MVFLILFSISLNSLGHFKKSWMELKVSGTTKTFIRFYFIGKIGHLGVKILFILQE